VEDFGRVQATFLALDGDSPPSLPAILECVGVALRCSRAVRDLGIMSKNERVEDINTEDLKYLLVDFYHAALLQQVHGPGVRGPHVGRAAQGGSTSPTPHTPPHTPPFPTPLFDPFFAQQRHWMARWAWAAGPFG
jgi:hypothetical protein